MASKKQKKEITTTVNNEEHFMGFYNENNKKLIVVDVYPGWSGPCTAMYPTYNQLMISIDDFEKRIDILLLDQDKLVNYKNDKFSKFLEDFAYEYVIKIFFFKLKQMQPVSQNSYLFLNSYKILQLFYYNINNNYNQEGKIIDEVLGTNIPVFIEKVNKYIPLSY